MRGRIGPIAQFRLERTPDKREVDGSSPSRPTTKRNGGVAQLGEHLPCTQEAIGSKPFTSTNFLSAPYGGLSEDW